MEKSTIEKWQLRRDKKTHNFHVISCGLPMDKDFDPPVGRIFKNKTAAENAACFLNEK